MDSQIVRLLSMAVSILLCLVAFGTALKQESQSMSYIKTVSTQRQVGSIVQNAQNTETLDLSGYEIVALLAHQMRSADVQIDNSALYFSPVVEATVRYTINGVIIDTWEQLIAIPIDHKYAINYDISPEKRITQINYVSK